MEPVERGGILDVDTETHSEHWEVGGIPGGGSRHPRGDAYTYFRGDGHELHGVFEKVGTAVIDRTLHRTGMDWDDVSKVLVHQVTVPHLERFAELTGVPAGKLVVTVPELGNIASATIGVQLDRIFDATGATRRSARSCAPTGSAPAYATSRRPRPWRRRGSRSPCPPANRPSAATRWTSWHTPWSWT